MSSLASRGKTTCYQCKGALGLGVIPLPRSVLLRRALRSPLVEGVPGASGAIQIEHGAGKDCLGSIPSGPHPSTVSKAPSPIRAMAEGDFPDDGCCPGFIAHGPEPTMVVTVAPLDLEPA